MGNPRPRSTNDVWFQEWLRLTDEKTKAEVRQHIKDKYDYRSPTLIETLASQQPNDRDRLLGGVFEGLAGKAVS